MSLNLRLLAGAAVPFVVCLPAFAQVTISTATTAPVSTSTASGGNPSDVVITTNGSITTPAASGATGVTIDSNNLLTNNGSIVVKNSDNGIGVNIKPNLTTGYLGAGAINLGEDYTRALDSNSTVIGPYAQGTNRTGIFLQPGGTMNGSIDMTGGSITIQGNNSTGVSLQSILNGNYRQKGSIAITGTNALGLNIQQNITGNVDVGGSVTATGQNSTAVQVNGNIGGEFVVDGAVVGTGFALTGTTNYAPPTSTVAATVISPDNLLVGGTAMAVRGNLGYGLLIQGNAIGASTTDTIQNYNVNRTAGTITSIGSAPALLIAPLDGAAGHNIELMPVQETVHDTASTTNVEAVLTTFNYPYGFINRGSVTGTGLNVGFAANALVIAGSNDGTHTTTIDGGIFNGGTISASSYDASSTGLRLGKGAATSQLVNIGEIKSNLTSRGVFVGTAFQIDAGASLPSIVNNGSISSNVTGYNSDSVAFRDLSGTVTSFVNSQRISAGFTDDDTTDTVTSGTGKAIALDFSSNTTGITLTQQDQANNARIVGNIYFGSGTNTFNVLSGQVTGDTNFGTGPSTLSINAAQVTGAAIFGGPTANIGLANSATMTGDLTLGGAATTLSVTGGSTYDGAITRAASGGSLAIAVNNSTLNNRAAGTLVVNSLTATNASNIGFVVNNARVVAGTPIFNVLGAATISGDTKLTPIFTDFTNQPFTLRILNAGSLNLGGNAAAMLNASRPYIYDITLAQNGNGLDLTEAVKSPTELGLTSRQTAAYASVLSLLSVDPTVGAAFSSVTDKSSFLRAYSDLLPGPSSSLAQVISTNATAAFGATARRLDLITERPDSPGGAWVEQFGVYHQAKANADQLGVYGGGFGVAGGLDLVKSGTTVLGGWASIDSVRLDEQGRGGAPTSVQDTMLGGYGGWKFGHLAVNASSAVGFLNFGESRQITVGTLADSMKASWNGYSFNSAVRATYAVPVGVATLKPYAALDYLGLWQDGYRETATATTPTGLALDAGTAQSHLGTGSYGVALAAEFGPDDTMRIRPEVSVGYRNIIGWSDKTARLGFAGGGSVFHLTAGHQPEDALTAGLGVDINSPYLNIKIGYDAEIANSYSTQYGSVTLRLAFW